MEVLSELIEKTLPVDEHLTEIWTRLPDATLAEEQARLQERFLDIAGKLVGISQIRGAE